MTTPFTLENLCRIVAQTPGVSTTRELQATTVLRDLGIDSLSLLNVMLGASTAFGISLKAVREDARVPATVGELFDFLANLNQESTHGAA